MDLCCSCASQLPKTRHGEVVVAWFAYCTVLLGCSGTLTWSTVFTALGLVDQDAQALLVYIPGDYHRHCEKLSHNCHASSKAELQYTHSGVPRLTCLWPGRGYPA